MIKKLTGYLDYSMFAEIAVVMFAAIFVSIVVRTLLTRREITEQQANIVINDGSEDHA